jgi:hypothetical protein
MYRLICQKPGHLLSAQMALVSTFFQMFIVLGMYNFVTRLKLKDKSTQEGEWPYTCAIFKKNTKGNDEFVGGATLIAPGVLVTAAHKIE